MQRVAASGSEQLRRSNLSALLTMVHRDGPLPRAEITERTGLNRSTVGTLVADLVARGLATESAPDATRRVGRPSPLVSADPDVVAVAVNPEVDAIDLAVVGLDRSLVARTRLERDRVASPADVVATVADEIARWCSSELTRRRVAGIGVAVPGLVRRGDGVVRRAPHLDWDDVPLRDLLTEATGLAVVVDNDATLGAHAEHLFGAARGEEDIVYLNGGASGIGGGLVVGGALYGGAGGFAGEFGQNRPGIANPADRRSGASGVLEDEVSRARLLASLGMPHADESVLAAALRAARGPEVDAEVERQRRILATALANAVNVLNPSLVVVGGFLATLVEHDLDGFESAVRAQAMSANAETLRVRPAGLGEDRLLIGAAEAAFAPLLADPLRTDALPPD